MHISGFASCLTYEKATAGQVLRIKCTKTLLCRHYHVNHHLKLNIFQGTIIQRRIIHGDFQEETFWREVGKFSAGIISGKFIGRASVRWKHLYAVNYHWRWVYLERGFYVGEVSQGWISFCVMSLTRWSQSWDIYRPIFYAFRKQQLFSPKLLFILELFRLSTF